jgi:hypothetical protein
MCSIRRIPGENIELESFCRWACGTKDGVWHAIATSARYSYSGNKLRGACSTAAHAKDPHKSMKRVGRIATGSSDVYLEAIAAPRIIAQAKNEYLTYQ